jgi:bifunctional non-homologous end joining protein LigD
LRSRPLIERGRLLEKLPKNAPDNIRFSEELHGTREELLRLAKQFPARRLDRQKAGFSVRERPSQRCWGKVKLTHQRELVIGGYTLPEGSRTYFGALLVGYNGPGGLLYAGSVGTGFSEKALETLYDGLQKIIPPTCPFINLPEKSKGRGALGLPCGHENESPSSHPRHGRIETDG